MENVVRQQIHAGIYSQKCMDCSGAPTAPAVGREATTDRCPGRRVPGSVPDPPTRDATPEATAAHSRVQTRHERASSVMPSISPLPLHLHSDNLYSGHVMAHLIIIISCSQCTQGPSDYLCTKRLLHCPMIVIYRYHSTA